MLFAAERYRKRAEVRELAEREGAKADGGRELDTLDFREAAVIGVAQSTALVAGISRDGVTMGAGLARGLQALTRQTGNAQRPGPESVRAALDRFAPFRSLAACHVWASLNGEHGG